MKKENMSQLSSFNSAVSGLVINTILNPLREWLAGKGVNCTVEEMMAAIQVEKPFTFKMPTGKTPGIGASEILNKPKKELTDDLRCKYLFVKGNKQGTRCPAERAPGLDYCNGCKSKKSKDKEHPVAPGASKISTPGTESNIRLEARKVDGYPELVFMEVPSASGIMTFLARITDKGNVMTMVGRCTDKNLNTLEELTKEEKDLLQSKYSQNIATEESFKECKKLFEVPAPVAVPVAKTGRNSVSDLLSSVKT